jgi:PTH1 family peptidyl-tRNA hydrolase
MLAKPRTFMNLSGDSVSLLVRKFGVPLNDLLVIHDDLDLPLGKIRVRQGGGAAGHKGVESIIACLGSQDFSRIRVGIGRPQREDSPHSCEDAIVAYVLSDFTPDEAEIVESTVVQVADAIYCVLAEGLAAAMNRYN